MSGGGCGDRVLIRGLSGFNRRWGIIMGAKSVRVTTSRGSHYYS